MNGNQVHGTVRIPRIGIFGLFLLGLYLYPLYGQFLYDPLPDVRIPENFVVRQKYAEEIFSMSVAGPRYEYAVQPGENTEVKYEIQTQNGNVYHLFINKLDSGYPLYSRGSYIIRVMPTKIDQIKVFYQNDPGCYIRFRPDDETAEADIVLYGRPYLHKVEIPVPFKHIVTEPFIEILKRSQYTVDWGMIFPQDALYGQKRVESMADRIRNTLPELKDANDGALDDMGRPIFIDTLKPNPEGGLNCSGFAKWIVDGVYAGLRSRDSIENGGSSGLRIGSTNLGETPPYLSVVDMKEKHLDVRGNEWSEPFEESRDPYFGLDWTRNLAVSIARLEYPDAGIESTDVRYPEKAGYVEDIGYAVDDLPMVLYMDAVRYPGNIYLGSVNRLTGSDPALRQHPHVAVFFPYFDEHGVFSIVVMERNRETPLDSFLSANTGSHVHLVRIPSPDRFLLPGFVRGATINRY
jgi:hypothetical protein